MDILALVNPGERISALDFDASRSTVDTDVYNLSLNAELVVLSACQTALGKEVRGEGVVGLARAFMYAGTPRVVASLWTVPDVSTPQLMTRFCRGMLVDHLAPTAALRQPRFPGRNSAGRGPTIGPHSRCRVSGDKKAILYQPHVISTTCSVILRSRWVLLRNRSHCMSNLQ